MCTITIIPLWRPREGHDDGPRAFRLACNRDESSARPAARPPQVRWCGDRPAAMPTDPAGGGTWVAVNASGLALALLNVNTRASARHVAAPRSRGLIIPVLAGHGSAAEAAGAAAELDPTPYGPFRLVVIDGHDWAEIEWDGDSLAARRRKWDAAPLLFTSSGLGDALVEPPRRGLFEQMCGAAPSPAAQDAFHRHRWGDRPHLSVCMSRAGARTVSYTAVEVGPVQAVVRYWPVPPCTVAPRETEPDCVRISLTALHAKVLT